MIEKDLGFIINRYNFRESSLIVSIYTLRFGKINGILKGFYTSKKEFSSTLDTCSLNEFVFYPKKREIWLISFADLMCDYHFLRENVSKAQTAAIFLNLIDKAMQLWDKNPSVFYLLKDCLYGLESEGGKKVLYIFLIKFLTLSGFKPEFNRCISCHGELQGEIFLSISKGGLICKSCHRNASDYQKISKETSSSLLYIQNNNFPTVYRLNPSANCEKEIIFILEEFLRYHLDFDTSTAQKTRLLSRLRSSSGVDFPR
jgi:DNA repair protein RecO (recombination protein O)